MFCGQAGCGLCGMLFIPRVSRVGLSYAVSLIVCSNLARYPRIDSLVPYLLLTSICISASGKYDLSRLYA